MTDILTQFRHHRIVPVLVVDDAEAAGPLARALLDGGLPVAEVTFRTPAAPEVLRRMAAEQPDILVGAGTVLSIEQAVRATEAGARFVVSPGLNPRVVDYCLEHGIPVYPGVCTPTEIEMALERGLETVKLFPAEPMGGAPFLKAVAAPYPELEFIPTGGIGPDQLSGYLRLGPVVACGGSWMAPAEWLRGEFGCPLVALTRREVLSACDHAWSAVLHDGVTGETHPGRRYTVRVVDRVGGGDSFAAGLLYALLGGRDAPAALEFATAASALKLTIPGDCNRVSAEEVKALVDNPPPGTIRS